MKLLKILSIAFFFGSSALLAEPVLIVNPANSVSSTDKTEIKRILKGKIKSWGGQKVILVNNDETAVADPFLSANVEMSSAEFKKFWLEQQIKGKGSAPMTQKTSASVKLMVSQIPGGVGFVDQSVVDVSVKVVPVK